MTVAWFLTYHDRADASSEASETDCATLAGLLRDLPGLSRALVFTPASARDPYLKDAAAPQLALELYFDHVAALETAAAPGGRLQALADAQRLPSLAHLPARQQAMLLRRCPVPAANLPVPSSTCSYLVGYHGPAEDLNAWLAHYIEHHPPIMARFPAIREIEVCTRIDWYGFLPFAHESCMLRNRVAFDDAAALAAALASPVRHEMRADFASFPPFSGEVFHYPMATRELVA